MRVHLALLAPIMLVTTATYAQFSIAPAVPYGAISNPSGMTHADFDGDGDVDLATTGDNPDRAVVFRNAGDGTFMTSFNVLLPASSSPQDLIAGDFDGDMDADLAVALRDPAGSVQILLNQGAAGFSLGNSFAVGSRPRGLSLADYDGDLDLDLAVANPNSDSLSILTNNGSGGFSVISLGVGMDPRATTFGNFFPDAGLELAVTNHDSGTVTILDQTAGLFSSVATLNLGAQLRPDGITTGDYNGDGLADLAVATGNPDFASVFVNNGAGFNGPFNYATGGLNSSGIRTADLNCDGHPDLVVSNSDSHNISVLANNGNGTFAAAQVFATGNEPSELTIGNWDGDRDLDIAVANKLSNNISVLINDTCATVSGDFNGDGIYDCTDVDALVGVIVTGSNLPQYDLSGDGQVNHTDLTQWLAEAGAVNLASGNPYLPGDSNLDGMVDGVDFIQWNANKFTMNAAWCSGDFNADGIVDGVDFVIWNQHKFTSADSGGAAAVPEPSGCLGLGLAFGLVLAGRQRGR